MLNTEPSASVPSILFPLISTWTTLPSSTFCKKFEKAIAHYTTIISTLNEDSNIKSDLLYRRGGSYERLGKHKESDEDLLNSLRINPDDAYVLNYLAYSWLERDYEIDKAFQMLEKAYDFRSDDPYIIDSLGWALFKLEKYKESKNFLQQAVRLMPGDPIVNDQHSVNETLSSLRHEGPRNVMITNTNYNFDEVVSLLKTFEKSVGI